MHHRGDPPRPGWGRLRRFLEALGQRRVVPLPPTGNRRLDSRGLATVTLPLTEMARIGQQRPRLAHHVLHRVEPFERWRHLLLVTGALAHMLGHDEVAVAVHRRLRVATLHEPLRRRQDAGSAKCPASMNFTG